MQDFFQYLNSIDPLVVYGLVLGFAFVENLFPPSPSDMMIIAAGSLVGIGKLDFVATLLVATAGSTIGFVMMYKVGDWFGRKHPGAGEAEVHSHRSRAQSGTLVCPLWLCDYRD